MTVRHKYQVVFLVRHGQQMKHFCRVFAFGFRFINHFWRFGAGWIGRSDAFGEWKPPRFFGPTSPKSHSRHYFGVAVDEPGPK